MKKIESIFIGTCLFAAIAVSGAAVWTYTTNKKTNVSAIGIPETNFGAFLALQHAIYVNDFDTALKTTKQLQDVEIKPVKNATISAEFLAGKMPKNPETLKNEKTLTANFIYDAYLVKEKKWKELYSRHKNDESALVAPFKIWSGIANEYITKTLKFIDKLPTNDSWRSFVRGQIYAELGKVDDAVKNFEKVSPDFMNINDYLYIMSFYKHFDMPEKAATLKYRFTSRPAGMFMINFNDIPDWSKYQGFDNALAFSLLQNVSHTQIMLYSDLSVLMLRFAEVAAPAFAENYDAMNYYLGQYLHNNNSDAKKYFSRIKKNSPFYPFVALKQAEQGNSIENLRDALEKYPNFVPAINKVVGHYIKTGNKRAALRTINNAIGNEKLDDTSRAFFIKTRAQIYYSFNDLDMTQRDIDMASESLATDPEILSLQAKVWAAKNTNIEEAYKYAMALVTKNPADILAWDTLGVVVAAREGADAALEVLERVGEVSRTHSPLFVHLGDIYVSVGELDKAAKSYMRAIDLSDDGLIVVPEIERKIRKIK